MFIFERDRDKVQVGEGRERRRYRIQSRLQALSCQHRAQCRAGTHELMNCDITTSAEVRASPEPPRHPWRSLIFDAPRPMTALTHTCFNPKRSGGLQGFL